jgi:MoxR-like ATPase
MEIMMVDNDRWLIYRGNSKPHDGIAELPDPPPWRRFGGEVPDDAPPLTDLPLGSRPDANGRAKVYFPSSEVIEMVNAALYLRRPLLVTGKPGTGKSALAYNVAYELALGPVLTWSITSHSVLQDALYRYDAIGRLQEANLTRGDAPDIGRYVRLGPLGTALLPGRRPRVLLIDELDKSDVDMPNDLLNVFEEGGFDITELMRLPEDQREVGVMTADAHVHATVVRGEIRCHAFPFVVITSNGEREFPPPFLRRCLRLNMQPPGAEMLAAIVAGHLGERALADSEQLIEQFMESRDYGDLATDQLLNAIYLVTSGSRPAGTSRERMIARLFRPLDGSAGQP